MASGRSRSPGNSRASQGRRAAPWANWSDEDLLDLRLCDLDLRIEGTPVAPRIERVYWELEQRQINLKPHVWFATEWFAPDGVPGFGVPFYLAHPRLMALEKSKMLEVEGGTEAWCLRILRHEAGHAISNGYRLHYRKSWRDTFGRYSLPYPDVYRPRPKSRNYVLHLDWWYAQAHPAEDFAETFAVWLKPGSRWRSEYKGWPALRKLEYVDRTMAEIAGKAPAVRSREQSNSLRAERMTLREHYQRRQEQYGDDVGDLYDRDLRRLFSAEPRFSSQQTAAQFLWRSKRRLRTAVSEWTRSHPYTVDRVIRDMADRCKVLELRLTRSPDETLTDALLMVAMQTMYLVRGGQRVVAL
ncbi:MAG: hypothetical protein AB7O52_10965 [Planctomycetota bacterium]